MASAAQRTAAAAGRGGDPPPPRRRGRPRPRLRRLHHLPRRRLRAPVPPPLPVPPPPTRPRVPRVRQPQRIPPRRAAPPVCGSRTRPRESRRLHLLLPRHPQLLATLRWPRPPLPAHQHQRGIRKPGGLQPLGPPVRAASPLPDDLAPVTGGWGMQEFDPFLDPASKVEDDLSSFRVICAVQCQHKLLTFHFSSGTGKWRGITFNRSTPLTDSLARFPGLFERHYVRGCFYWTVSFIDSFMFMLDMHEMKLCVVDLPTGRYGAPHSWAVVEAGEGRVGLLIIGDGMLELYSKTLRSNGVGTEEWQHDKIIPLPEMDCYWHIPSTTESYLLLQANPRDSSPSSWPQMPESLYFTLDLKTLLVERLCVLNQHINGAHLYASFPPLLSLPSI